MKKTIATCLLLILILSCVFSFVACTDKTDPIVGKYKWIAPSITDSETESYFDVRSDGTATKYSIYVKTLLAGQINTTLEYTWSYDEETQIYTFKDIYGRYSADEYKLVNGTIKWADPQYSGSYGQRITDSEWPDILK